MSVPTGPNIGQQSHYYRGSGGGGWVAISTPSAATKPAKKSAVIEVEKGRAGQRIAGHATDIDPAMEGTITVRDIQPTATDYTLRDAVLGINGGDAVTPTNDSASYPVSTRARLLDYRIVTDQSDMRGGVWEDIYLATEFKFEAGPAESATGATLEVPLVVHGAHTRSQVS